MTAMRDAVCSTCQHWRPVNRDGECDACRAYIGLVALVNLGVALLIAGLCAEIARRDGASADGLSRVIDERVRLGLAERFGIDRKIPTAGAP